MMRILWKRYKKSRIFLWESFSPAGTASELEYMRRQARFLYSRGELLEQRRSIIVQLYINHPSSGQIILHLKVLQHNAYAEPWKGKTLGYRRSNLTWKFSKDAEQKKITDILVSAQISLKFNSLAPGKITKWKKKCMARYTCIANRNKCYLEP